MATTTSASLLDILTATPAKPIMGAQLTARLLETLSACEMTCVICADACLGEDMVGDLRRCISLNLSCADACQAMARLGARSNGADPTLLNSSLRHCAEACRTCANECGGHAGMMAHCRICMEACRLCEQVCVEASRVF
jgi:hypothetical protein